MHEQFGYAYDAAWNLNYRTNNALVEAFGGNNLNELTATTRGGTLTVAGTAGEHRANYQGDTGVTNVTVSGTGLSSGAAELYADGTWARAGASPANGQNSYTATAQDTYGRTSQDTASINLPATNTFGYDGNGNLLSDGQRYFEYDWENRLTNVYVSGQWRSEFAYDGLMRRRVRKEYKWSGSAWLKTNEVRYVYDGLLVIQERDANNLPLVSYTRANDLSGELQGAGGIGGLLARTDPSTLNSQLSTAFYHCDGNGNVTALLNSNQVLVAQYTYDPYGNTLAASGPLAQANLYRFSSKEYHPNSGTVYYLYRYYDPNLQRWLNRDPMEDEGGFNLYAFVANNPLSWVDLLGLQGCHLWDIQDDPKQNEKLDKQMDDYRKKEAALLADRARAIAKMGIDSLSPMNAAMGPVMPVGKFLEGESVLEAGAHAAEVGKVTGIVDRTGAAARRAERLKGLRKVPNKQLDEYPPAVIKPDDPSKVSIKPINPSHNMASGGKLRHELPADGTRVEIQPPSPFCRSQTP